MVADAAIWPCLFMQTTSAADYAVGDYWGAVASETRSWIDHLMTGRECPHTTPAEARRTLAVTLAMLGSLSPAATGIWLAVVVGV